MNLTELHRRLLADVLTVGEAYPLVLTGGYAVQAHGLVDRLSKDLDVATENPEPMEKIAASVRAGLEQRGWQVRALETDPLSARLIVTDTSTGEVRGRCPQGSTLASACADSARLGAFPGGRGRHEGSRAGRPGLGT